MMRANINGRGMRRAIDSRWFTGKTWMRTVSDVVKSDGHDIHHVHFESGSRTKLHTHNGNQILIVTGGKGSLEIFEKIAADPSPGKSRRTGPNNTQSASKNAFSIKKTKTVRLLEGDVVHVPLGTLHTHGSVDDDAKFSHIAINVLPHKKNPVYKTTWYESDFRTLVSDII